jgi:hypothetical protein
VRPKDRWLSRVALEDTLASNIIDKEISVAVPVDWTDWFALIIRRDDEKNQGWFQLDLGPTTELNLINLPAFQFSDTLNAQPSTLNRSGIAPRSNSDGTGFRETLTFKWDVL